MAIENLERMYYRADAMDREEGLLAYERYNLVMQRIAERFQVPLEKVVAVFVALSPNSSYHQNLRSAISVIDGWKRGKHPDDIVVSTYAHCKLRALSYLVGSGDFWRDAAGPKIRSFYRNILDPHDREWVTVDGHMSAIWQDKNLTMKKALISRRVYMSIRDATIELAARHEIIPCQMQATLWFVRKRTANVVYDPQMQLFGERGDVWNTLVDIKNIKPYAKREEANALHEKLSSRKRSEIGGDHGPAGGPLLFGHDELASVRRVDK